MFYLRIHSIHFIYGYMALDIMVVRVETWCSHIMCNSFTAKDILYESSRQESTYHGLCYASCEALDGMRNSLMGAPQGINVMTCRQTHIHTHIHTYI